ncbi:unnamed protein product [Pieris macdunnoughi]|uniref:Uncharacterized protein n=1 Tax=Pieris macdunnoughi TaxID=345717 RepID=A0A821Y714_9NEOP|nr:unnamed protein product [Pieris macdunnoughi]
MRSFRPTADEYSKRRPINRPIREKADLSCALASIHRIIHIVRQCGLGSCRCYKLVLSRPSVLFRPVVEPDTVMVMASGGGGMVQSPPDMLHHHNIMDTSSHVEMMPSK